MVACQTALNTIKHAITNSSVLIYPNPSKEYHLFSDASHHTWSSVLTQQNDVTQRQMVMKNTLTTQSDTKALPFQLYNSSGQ